MKDCMVWLYCKVAFFKKKEEAIFIANYYIRVELCKVELELANKRVMLMLIRHLSLELSI